MKFLIFNIVVAGALGWMLGGAPMMKDATETQASAPAFTRKVPAPEPKLHVVDDVGPSILTKTEQAALNLTPDPVITPTPAPVEAAAVQKEVSPVPASAVSEIPEPLSPRTPKVISSPPKEQIEFTNDRVDGLREEGSSTFWTVDEQDMDDTEPRYMTTSERRVALHNIARDMEQLFLKSAE